MLIKGTSKIKGALDLAGISKQLVTGEEISITEDEFYDHTVQIALKMGMLSYRKGSHNIFEGSKYINLKSTHDKSITVNVLSADVRPGESFKLSEDQVNSSDIRAALAKGLIQVVSAVKADQSTEASVKVGDVFSESVDENIDNTDDNYLETNEELGVPKIVDDEPDTRIVEMKNVIDTDTPKPISKNDIKDPKKKSVVWNPNKEPVAHTQTKMESISVNKDNSEHSPISEEDIDVGDLSFVDQEMDAKKRASHPKLKEQPISNNDELDFV